MEFVAHTKEGWRINDAAASYLAQADYPLRIVGVAGNYRAGKSTLLNRLIGKQLFATSASTQSQTKGLWFAEWEKGLLLLDCEGLSSTEAGDEHDYNVFALCVLLCSAFLYNNFGAITAAALQSLKLAGKLAQVLARTDFKLSSTLLVWIARDFNLEMVDHEGKEVDADAYLETHIGTTPGVATLFPNRRCVTLPRPAADDKDVSHMRNVTQQFKDSIAKLAQFLKGSVAPKTCNGAPMTGPMLLALARSVVDGINAGATNQLNLLPVWDAAVASREREARACAIRQLEAAGGELDVFELLSDVCKTYCEALHEPNANSLEGLRSLVQRQGEILKRNLAQWNGELKAFPVASCREALLLFTQKQLNALQSQINQVERERDALKTDLISLGALHQQESQEFATKMDALRKERSDAQEENAKQQESWQTRLIAAQVECVRLQEELDECCAANEEAEEELKKMASQTINLESELQRLRPLVTLHQGEADKYRGEAIAQLEVLKAALTERQKETNELSAAKELAETRLRQLETQLHSLQQRVLHDQRNVSSDLERLKNENGALLDKSNRLKEELYQAKMDLAVATSREESARATKRQRGLETAVASLRNDLLVTQQQADKQRILQLEEQNQKLQRQVFSLEVSLQTERHKKELPPSSPQPQPT